MPGSIIPRGEATWLVRFYEGHDPHTGKRLYQNKTIHGTKKDAQRYLTGALRARDLGAFTGPADITVGALLDGLLLDYKANGKDYDWAALVVRVHLRPFFGAMKAAHVGTDQIQSYIVSRQQAKTRKFENGWVRKIPPAANATINRSLALLHRAYNLGKMATPPKVTSIPSIRMLAENNTRKGFFEDDAFLAVRAALPEEIRPVVTYAYYTGCRKGEILGLQWPQIDLEERVIRLEPGETKNDEARTIFMAPELYETLAIQKEIRDRYFPDCPWVFFPIGKPILDFRNAWDRACHSAGLVTKIGDKSKPARLFHDLRRTGVRNLVRAGVPERVAMMISGHKTRDVFDRYNIVSESDLRDAARRQGEYVARKRATLTKRHTIGTQEAAEAVH